MKRYNHSIIEKKWQRQWETKKFYRARDFDRRRKFYALVEFPYPSGEGLHVGHVRSYTALDAIARWKRMSGFNVLYPIGFDAFGLPTENFAIKNKLHPRVATDNNIKTFTRQLKALGLSFDWSRAIDTTDPKYYKWTQWIFLQLYKAGLATRQEIPINWCPACKTGLANEEVIDGHHERCGTAVTKKLLKQWVIKITRYAERLIEDLRLVNYPERVKTQQINWIGKSEGAEITFNVVIPAKAGIQSGSRIKSGMTDRGIRVFTTRADTLFGSTFLVVSPELAQKWLAAGWQAKHEVKKYIQDSLARPEMDRQDERKEKTGVDSGLRARHPLTREDVPVWIADYVLGSYGTGAIMAVPAHDERDFAFAKKYKLLIKPVIRPPDVPTRDNLVPEAATGHLNMDLEAECWTGEGTMINSYVYNGLSSSDGRKRVTKDLEKKGLGKSAVSYKLRDWIFSRQHYWGEPIPLVFCKHCAERLQIADFRLKNEFSKGELENPGWIAVPEKDLPVLLPKVKNYEPTQTGESPLASIKKFLETKCPRCGGNARRETDTMPNWAGSNWYYIRYLDPHNQKEFSAKDKLEYWMGSKSEDATASFRSPDGVGGVDLYNGGMEHTTLHLLYSRFIYKFLYDQKLVPGPEPYARRTSHGIILGPDGRKMSKSRGNVINPDAIIKEYGADTLRLYEMFIAPFDQMVPWAERGVVGARRFLERVWKFYQISDFRLQIADLESQKLINKLILKITSDLREMKFNTAVAAFMETLNALERENAVSRDAAEKYLVLLAPFAPHIAEELWHQLYRGPTRKGTRTNADKSRRQSAFSSVHQQPWPVADEQYLVEEILTLAVAVNGKVRDTIQVPADMPQKEIENRALNSPKVAVHLKGKTVARTVYVAGKMVNFVVS